MHEASFSQHRNIPKKAMKLCFKSVVHRSSYQVCLDLLPLIIQNCGKKVMHFLSFFYGKGIFNNSFIKILEWKFVYSSNNKHTCICL